MVRKTGVRINNAQCDYEADIFRTEDAKISLNRPHRRQVNTIHG